MGIPSAMGLVFCYYIKSAFLYEKEFQTENH
jgi:hypothetical protein